jgi:PncC family amidohydrolase
VVVPATGRAEEDAAPVAVAGEQLVGLAERLQAACLERGLTVAVAESCTGGLVADAITDIPGSSGYFLGGIVSYADTAKAALLGVPVEVLAAHGAVSAQVGRAMAEGARERFSADLAASVTGVAGPDGGSDAKPVGLTYVAVAAAHGADVRRFVWNGDRAANKEASAAAVLEILVEWASEVETRSSGAADESIAANGSGTTDESR